MMKKRTKGLVLMSVLLTLTIALSGCAGEKKVEEASSEITIGIPQDIEESLDPHKAVAAGTREVLFNIYEGLVKPDSEGNLIPAVASNVTVSEDGTTYTFTLRDNVKFHDGTTVTVEDVKYSIDRCADTSEGDPLVPAYSDIEATTIVDNKTFEIKLKEPNAEFLAYMTTAIIPKSNQDPGTNPIGTGPYKFVSHTPQESFVMESFDDYWGEKANIKDVTFKVVADADAIAMNLNGGSVDMMARVTPAQAAELSDEFTVYEGTMNLVQALYLNNAQAPFDDVRVRQALCYATDRQGVLDLLSDGKGTIIGSSMFPTFAKYYDASLADTYQTNVEKAKALLTEAGYPDGFTFTIKVPSNYTQHVETAQILEEQYKAIGVNCEIELIEWDSWLSDVYTDRNYQATVIGVDASSLTASALLSRFESSADNNFVNFKSEAYDAAYAKAMAAVNEEEQIADYKECQKVLTDEAANVYIQDLPQFVALNKKYGGYEFYPLYAQDIAKLYIVDESKETSAK